MLLGIAGFEIRYQLRNPVFWVAIAIFFLLGFGITASENVSIGTPGAVHENAPDAIAVANRRLLAFLPVRDHRLRRQRDCPRRVPPASRRSSERLASPRRHIVIGRFIAGLIDRMARVSRASRSAWRAGSVDALGRSRDGSATGPLVLFLAVPGLRDPEHLPDLRGPVRARDRRLVR